jgi:hypothetical protein
MNASGVGINPDSAIPRQLSVCPGRAKVQTEPLSAQPALGPFLSVGGKKRPSLLADAVLLFHLVSFIVSALGEPSFDISIYFETKLEASPRQPAALLV